MEFSKSLINWYLQNKRDLPWRKSVNPYHIWLSEIMLQQTRVAQGLPFFLRFIDAFPTVFDLAAAHEEQVLKLWQGLGYYSRARNLHATAKHIANELDGKFPETYSELLNLKGVGEYTAAAIASIAYGEAVPVVDGNVFRVLARYYGISSDISAQASKKEFAAVAASLLPAGHASSFNQAMMEFGALQCVPKSPNCPRCVFSSNCVAFQTGQVASLPVKLAKTKVISRFFNYLIVKDGAGNTIINKRTAKGIWHNLYEFPLMETDCNATSQEVAALIKNNKHLGFEPLTVTLLNEAKLVHKLSHQHLSIHFWEVTTNTALRQGMPVHDIIKYPFPVVIYNFIEKHWGVNV